LKQFNTSTRQRRYNAPWRKFPLHHFWTKQWASFYFSLYVQATDTFCRCCKRFYSTKGHRPSPPAQDSGVDELWNKGSQTITACTRQRGWRAVKRSKLVFSYSALTHFSSLYALAENIVFNKLW